MQSFAINLPGNHCPSFWTNKGGICDRGRNERWKLKKKGKGKSLCSSADSQNYINILVKGKMCLKPNGVFWGFFSFSHHRSGLKTEFQRIFLMEVCEKMKENQKSRVTLTFCQRILLLLLSREKLRVVLAAVGSNAPFFQGLLLISKWQAAIFFFLPLVAELLAIVVVKWEYLGGGGGG